MKKPEDIGVEIKERLKAFKAEPSPLVWGKIEEKLKKKRKKRLLFIWLFSMLFMSILITPIIHFQVKKTSASNKTEIDTNVKPQTQNTNKQRTTSNSSAFQTMDTLDLKANDSQENLTKISNHDNNVPVIEQNTEVHLKKDKKIRHNKNLTAHNSKSRKDSFVQNTLDKNNSLNEWQNTLENEAKTTDSTQLQPIKNQNQLKKPELEKGKDTLNNSIEENHEKWSVALQHNLTNYNSFSSKSIYDSRLSGLNNSSTFNSNFGFFFSYHPTNTFNLRIGFNVIKVTETTHNLENQRNTLFNLQNVSKAVSDDIIQNFILNNTEIALMQNMTYLEFPLEFRYVLNQSKWRIHTVAGLSFWSLHSDETVLIGSENLTFGNLNNLNNIGLTFNAGFGVQTKLIDKFYLNIEPIFKYHISQFSNKSRPSNYFINIGTGLEYKF